MGLDSAQFCYIGSRIEWVLALSCTGMYYEWSYISKSMDQPGKIANPARGQPKKGNEYFPVRVRA